MRDMDCSEVETVETADAQITDALDKLCDRLGCLPPGTVRISHMVTSRIEAVTSPGRRRILRVEHWLGDEQPHLPGQRSNHD